MLVGAFLAFLAGTAITLTGTYRDELIRADGGWQISARDVTDG